MTTKFDNFEQFMNLKQILPNSTSLSQESKNRNIGGKLDTNDVSTGYLVFGVFITLLLLLCGAMALWCRRKYQEYFIREREAFDVPDIIAGEMYYGMVKDDEVPEM